MYCSPVRVGGPGGFRAPVDVALSISKSKNLKWKFEINQGTKVTGAALVVMTMTKAATLIVTSVTLL